MEAFELSEDEKTHNERIRARSSSQDSTRGAFFNQAKIKATTSQSRQTHPHLSGSGPKKPPKAGSHAFAGGSGHDKPAKPDPFSRNDIETPMPLEPMIDPLQYSEHSFDFSPNDSWLVSPHGSDNLLSSGSLSEMDANLRGTFRGPHRPPPAPGYLPPALVQAQQQEIHYWDSNGNLHCLLEVYYRTVRRFRVANDPSQVIAMGSLYRHGWKLSLASLHVDSSIDIRRNFVVHYSDSSDEDSRTK